MIFCDIGDEIFLQILPLAFVSLASFSHEMLCKKITFWTYGVFGLRKRNADP